MKKLIKKYEQEIKELQKQNDKARKDGNWSFAAHTFGHIVAYKEVIRDLQDLDNPSITDK